MILSILLTESNLKFSKPLSINNVIILFVSLNQRGHSYSIAFLICLPISTLSSPISPASIVPRWQISLDAQTCIYFNSTKTCHYQLFALFTSQATRYFNTQIIKNNNKLVDFHGTSVASQVLNSKKGSSRRSL